MIPADKALQRLRQGNETFRSGKGFHLEIETLLKLNSQKGQNPFAIILGCSDSRVPAEIIFGQEIGDLFVFASLAISSHRRRLRASSSPRRTSALV
jgi:carbonic anhydrase